jgi:hypothetical protein
MSRAFRSFLAVFFLGFAASLVDAQIASGSPPDGTPSAAGLDRTSFGNLSAGSAIPVQGSESRPRMTPGPTQATLIAAAELPGIGNHASNGTVEACPAFVQEAAVNPSVTAHPQQACTVPPTPHYVQYRAYIPADHLITAVFCYKGQALASPVPPTLTSRPYGFIEVLGDHSSFSTPIESSSTPI